MLKIDEKYSIDRDTFNWILVSSKPKTIEKDGVKKEIVVVSNSFHASIKQCLSQYINEALNPCESAEMVLGRICEIESNIDKFLSYLSEHN